MLSSCITSLIQVARLVFLLAFGCFKKAGQSVQALAKGTPGQATPQTHCVIKCGQEALWGLTRPAANTKIRKMVQHNNLQCFLII